MQLWCAVQRRMIQSCARVLMCQCCRPTTKTRRPCSHIVEQQQSNWLQRFAHYHVSGSDASNKQTGAPCKVHRQHAEAHDNSMSSVSLPQQHCLGYPAFCQLAVSPNI
jgi:hypothetical protein